MQKNACATRHFAYARRMDNVVDFPGSSPSASEHGRAVEFITWQGKKHSYISPAGSFAADFTPATDTAPEQIRLFYDDFAVVIITGNNLKPLFTHLCEGTVGTVRESDPKQRDLPVTPYIEAIDITFKWQESELVDL